MIECVYCGNAAAEHMDHGVPRSKGGTDNPANLFPSCRTCNASKGARYLSPWLESLELRILDSSTDCDQSCPRCRFGHGYPMVEPLTVHELILARSAVIIALYIERGIDVDGDGRNR